MKSKLFMKRRYRQALLRQHRRCYDVRIPMKRVKKTIPPENLARPFLSRTYIGELLTNVVDEMLEGLQVISPDWRYLYVNDTVCRQGKMAREAMLGRTMKECYPGIEKTPLWKEMQTSMKKCVSTEFKNTFTFPDASKEVFLLHIHPVKEGIMILSTQIPTPKKRKLPR